MSNDLRNYSFNDLLKQGKIRIPKIQRDYAQGRINPKVNEIRKVFIHTLLLVVKGKRPATELDFIYGSNNMGAFEPLDGQQRLTTLFLLHWMLGVDLRICDDKKHSMFTYETRNTSDEFCDEIVQHKASQFVDEAMQKNSKPSVIIKGRDWFKWEWKYDPTILSMLVVIDTIFDEMGSDWNMDLSICRTNLNNITFNLLNLGDFGLSNELFIKMNARGKQLSDFDKLKSTLEEELQIQQQETDEQGIVLASPENEKMWRTLMDGAWIDLFWHKYARNEIAETETSAKEDCKTKCMNAAKKSELQFKKLLLRLIALQLFENNPSNESLREAAYSIDEANIDDLLFAYTDSLTDLRSDEDHPTVPSTQVTLNFPRLINDVNLLIYKDSHSFNEISNLLPPTSHIDDNGYSLFDTFLDSKVANDAELVFYSFLLFLRAFPAKKVNENESEDVSWDFDAPAHRIWLKNLECWVRAMRNILLNDNNNQRLDKIQFSMEATQSLKMICSDFENFVISNNLNIEADSSIVKQFFKSLKGKTYQRLDNQSLLEEIQKAALILDNKDVEWEAAFNKAESHKYLWGQIRCLLNWSGCNYDKFIFYRDRLIQVLDYIEKNELKYYSAILAIIPDCWYENNRLFLYNKDRDNSFKRYLRERNKEGQTYGANLKKMIDIWWGSYSELSVDMFIDSLIESKKKTADVWIRCILEYPTILDEAWNKRIFSQNGHVIMAQRKTLDSHCFDPVLVFLRELCKVNGMKDNEYKLYDSKGDYTHGFCLIKDSHKYLIEWSNVEGAYSLKIDESESQKEYSSDELIKNMEEIIVNPSI